MKTRAAVAFEAKKPLEVVELDLEGPQAGEVLIEIMATGICHTDAYTLDGFDSEGIFPSVLGHEGKRFAVFIGDLLRTVLVDRVVVTGHERFVVAECDLLLTEIALALDAFAVESRAFHAHPDVAQ